MCIRDSIITFPHYHIITFPFMSNKRSQTFAGIALATLACILWSFNFIIARGISKQMPPVAISFYRWLCAAVIIIPIAWKRFSAEKHLVWRHWPNILLATLSGITLYS